MPAYCQSCGEWSVDLRQHKKCKPAEDGSGHCQKCGNWFAEVTKHECELKKPAAPEDKSSSGKNAASSRSKAKSTSDPKGSDDAPKGAKAEPQDKGQPNPKEGGKRARESVSISLSDEADDDRDDADSSVEDDQFKFTEPAKKASKKAAGTTASDQIAQFSLDAFQGAGEFELRAVANATSGGNAEQIRSLVAAGCLTPLCDLLSSRDVKTASVALEAIGNILGVGDDEKKQGGLSSNPYSDVLIQTKGLDAIEALQYHSNTEIYTQAMSILEAYFEETENPVIGAQGAPGGFKFADDDPDCRR